MLLKNRDFSLLWLGQLVSQIGDKVYSIGLVWWLLQQTRSPLYISSFIVASMLPEFLLSPLTGVYVDRWNRQRILIVTDVVRGLAVMAVASLHHSGALQIWHVHLAAIVISVSSALFNPAALSIIPMVVAKDDLHQANALSQLVSGTVSIVGPLFGASCVAFLGYVGVFVLNGVSYFLSAVAACLLRAQPTPVSTREPVLRGLVVGLRYIQANLQIRVILMVIALVHVFYGSLVVTLPFLSDLISSNGLGNLGVLEAAIGGGMIMTSIIIQRRRKSRMNERLMIPTVVLMGCGITSLGILGWAKNESLPLYAVASLAVGLGASMTTVFWRTTLQSTVPDGMMGRVLSVCSATGDVSLPLSVAVSGLLLDHISVIQLLLYAGLSLCAIALLMGRRYLGAGPTTSVTISEEVP